MRNRSPEEKLKAKKQSAKARQERFRAKNRSKLARQQKERRERTKRLLAEAIKELEAAKKRLEMPTFRLATRDEMKKVTSWFALRPITKQGRGKNAKRVKLRNGVKYILFLNCWEIYSVKDVSIFLRGRHILDKTGKRGTRRMPPRKSKKGWIVIGADVEQSIDHDNDKLHVVREGSPILQELGSDPKRNNQIYENGGKLNINYSILVNGLMTKGAGNGDDDRSPDSKRIIFCYTEKGDPFRTFQKPSNHSTAAFSSSSKLSHN